MHVNDCAATAAQLVRRGRDLGLPWTARPRASAPPVSQPTRLVATGVVGVGWLADLELRALRTDLLHVHYATVARHTRWVPRPYVLHAHGTDVRTQLHQTRWAPTVRRALTGARAVLYSTPDLAEHVLPVRPDAQYFPVPVDVERAPRWQPSPKAVVAFSSRWAPVKGAPLQLATARALRRALPADVELVGLDWGPAAAEAARAGVRLVPPMPREEFLAWLARASVVVGQGAGILAASELEAMAVGVPIVAALRADWYADAPPPVLLGAGAPPEPEAAVEAVRAALTDPVATSSALSARAWLGRQHDVRVGVERLRTLYRDVTGAHA